MLLIYAANPLFKVLINLKKETSHATAHPLSVVQNVEPIY